MYRLLLSFAIFTIFDGHYCHRHGMWRHQHRAHWRHHDRPIDNPDKNFSEIAQNHIEFEAALQNFCINNANNRTSEIYDSENYILKYNIPEYENLNFIVKTVNRLIFVSAKKDEDGNKVFEDMRVLPDILDVEKGKWIFESKVLKIIIPYKTMFGKDIVKDCGVLSDRIVIDVPRLEYPKIDIRMFVENSISNVSNEDEQNGNNTNV